MNKRERPDEGFLTEAQKHPNGYSRFRPPRRERPSLPAGQPCRRVPELICWKLDGWGFVGTVKGVKFFTIRKLQNGRGYKLSSTLPGMKDAIYGELEDTKHGAVKSWTGWLENFTCSSGPDDGTGLP